jgi:hypothetical protein
MVYGNVATCTESGVAESITVLMKAASSLTEKMKCAIYQHSDSVWVGTTEERSIDLTTSLQNFTFNFVGTKPTITAQIYVLTVMFDWPTGGGESTRTSISSDTGVANAFHYIVMAYGSYPNPASFTSIAGDATIWCTYSNQVPVVASGSPGTNTTLVVRNWLFHSQWFMSLGNLSGFIFSYNASTSMVNDTWVAFAETNNSWANVSKLVSNDLATVILWTVYANGSSNSWNVMVNQYATATAELTCSFNTGGFVRVNGTNMGNNTALTYTQAISIANLGALSSNASYGFMNFTWSVGISGSSTTNSYNLTVYNCTTLWAYFYFSSSYLQACFNFTPSNPAANAQVTFNGTFSVSSAAILNYTWNFGDGNITSGAAYSVIYHTYTGNDTYLITLTVGGSLGNSSLSLGLVVGWGANHTEPAYIFASFTWSPPNPAIADWVTFNGSASQSSASIANYTWQFETGAEWASGVSSTIQHQYTGNDTFAVSLIVGGTVGNSSTFTLTITVGWGANHTCVAAFTYSISRFEFSPSNPGNTTMILFNGSQSYSTEAITDFSWNFGDGNVTSSGAQDWIEHGYGTDGSYAVTFTVSSTATNTSAMCFQELSVEAGGGGSVSRAGYAAYWLAGAIVVLLILIPTIVIVVRRRH